MGVPMQSLKAAVLQRIALVVALVVWITGCSGQAATITLASCSFALSPSSASYDTSGGTGSVAVTTPANCSWIAMADVDWIIVTGGNRGDANGTVTYSVAPNMTTTLRTASIKVVDEDGCCAAVLHPVRQPAATWLTIRVANLFVMKVDPNDAGRWPVTTCYWRVAIEVSSNVYSNNADKPEPTYPAQKADG